MRANVDTESLSAVSAFSGVNAALSVLLCGAMLRDSGDVECRCGTEQAAGRSLFWLLLDEFRHLI